MRSVLEIAYDGSDFHGWQVQPNAHTVQAEMDAAISRLMQEEIHVVGCGRTDTGVHALQYFLHFDSTEAIPDRFVFRLNQMVSKSIAIKSLREVDDKFHTRFDATYRKYIYKIHLEKNPFIYGKSLFLFQHPSIDKMNAACEILMNTVDFASFCKSGGDNKTTLCELMEAQWIQTGSELEFHVKANRFLRNMVRALVGTLLEVGYGKMTLEELKKVIRSKDRSAAGKSVAAHGLYLAEVGYNWNDNKK